MPDTDKTPFEKFKELAGKVLAPPKPDTKPDEPKK